jgi:hypothetical protein
MHSPADLDVYDDQGRHVGINRELTNDNFKTFDTEIPGSDFYIIGDEKFAIIPNQGVFTIKINGTGNGLYTLDIKTQKNDQIINTASFNDLPVTPSLEGDLVLDTQNIVDSVLNIDNNGDGVVDYNINVNDDRSPLIYLETIRSVILELNLSKKLEKSLLAQIDKTINLLKKNKTGKATDKLQKFLKRVNMGHRINQEMTEIERKNLIVEINKFLNSF